MAIFCEYFEYMISISANNVCVCLQAIKRKMCDDYNKEMHSKSVKNALENAENILMYAFCTYQYKLKLWSLINRLIGRMGGIIMGKGKTKQQKNLGM